MPKYIFLCTYKTAKHDNDIWDLKNSVWLRESSPEPTKYSKIEEHTENEKFSIQWKKKLPGEFPSRVPNFDCLFLNFQGTSLKMIIADTFS